MRPTILPCVLILVLSVLPCRVLAQASASVLPEPAYQKAAGATVKIVSDSGRKIGSGVIVGVGPDLTGFVLTSYSMVAGRDKVAVILRNYSDALLGQVADKWIDFDHDLAIIAIKEFPIRQPVVTMDKSQEAKSGQNYVVIGHTDEGDWSNVPIELTSVEDEFFKLSLNEVAGCEGAPVVNKDGNLLGLLVTTEGSPTEGGAFGQAVRSQAMLPVLKDWFGSTVLQPKWREKGGGIGVWIWAVGGGILGGAVATMAAVSGGDDSTPSGLPRPPDPPPGGTQ